MAADQFLRDTSKLITTDDIMIDIGLEMDFTSSEIQAIRTDNPRSIVHAGYQLLLEWRKRLETLDTDILWHNMEPVFDKCNLGNVFRRKVQQRKKVTTNDKVEVCLLCKRELHSSADVQASKRLKSLPKPPALKTNTGNTRRVKIQNL